VNDPVEEHVYRWHRRIVFAATLTVILTVVGAWIVL
jgi:hypothetical protein